MSSTKFKRHELLLFLFPLIGGALILVFRTVHVVSPGENAQRSNCMSRMREIGIALAQYNRDFDGYFPPAVMNGGRGGLGTKAPWKPAGVGWVDALTSHSNMPISTFTCYGAKSRTPNPNMLPALPGLTNYWMNCNLSHVRRISVPYESATIMLGEGGYNDQSDATYCKAALPQSWREDNESPAFRHAGGANYATVDGAVHWLKPDAVNNFDGRKDAFALRN